jgi:hypothetical protein
LTYPMAVDADAVGKQNIAKLIARWEKKKKFCGGFQRILMLGVGKGQ